MATAAENKYVKRRRILEAANLLFLNGSVADTAIDDVVKLAGVAKGTFYLYFRDKYDLLDQIVMHHTAELFTRSCLTLRKKASGGRMSAAQQLIFLTDEIADYLQSHKRETALLDKRFSVCFTMRNAAEDPAFHEAVTYLTDLVASSGCSREEAQRRLYLLGTMVGGALCNAVLDTHPYTLEALKPTLRTMLQTFAGGDET